MPTTEEQKRKAAIESTERRADNIVAKNSTSVAGELSIEQLRSIGGIQASRPSAIPQSVTAPPTAVTAPAASAAIPATAVSAPGELSIDQLRAIGGGNAQQQIDAQPEAKTSNPLKGAVARASEGVGSLVEGVARIGERYGDKLESAVPLSGLTKEQIENERQLEPLFRWADAMKNWGQEIGYQPSTTLGDIPDNPLKLIPFIAERVITSTPDMAASVVAMPAYIVTRTNEILNERLKNDGKSLEDATVSDVAASTVAAVVESTLERFATKRILKPGASGASATARIGKEAALQSGTEALEEGAAYLGETAGTKAGVDPVEMGKRMLEGAIVGGGLGATVQGGKEAYDRFTGSSTAQEMPPAQQTRAGEQPDRDEPATPQSTTLDLAQIPAAPADQPAVTADPAQSTAVQNPQGIQQPAVQQQSQPPATTPPQQQSTAVEPAQSLPAEPALQDDTLIRDDEIQLPDQPDQPEQQPAQPQQPQQSQQQLPTDENLIRQVQLGTEPTPRQIGFRSETDAQLFDVGGMKSIPAGLRQSVADQIGVKPTQVGKMAQQYRTAVFDQARTSQGPVIAPPSRPQSEVLQTAVQQLTNYFRLPEGETLQVQEASTPALRRLADAVQRAFGTEVAFADFSPSGALLTSSGRNLGNFNGLRVGGRNALVINTRAANLMNVLAHELTHVLETKHPKIYAKLAAVAIERAGPEVKKKHNQFIRDSVEKEGGKPPTRKYMESELVADVVGEQAGDSAFWNEVFERTGNKNLVQQLRDVVMDVVNKILAAAQGPQYVKDRESILAVRAAVTEAFNAWVDVETQPAAQQSTAVGQTTAVNELQADRKKSSTPAQEQQADQPADSARPQTTPAGSEQAQQESAPQPQRPTIRSATSRSTAALMQADPQQARESLGLKSNPKRGDGNSVRQIGEALNRQTQERYGVIDGDDTSEESSGKIAVALAEEVQQHLSMKAKTGSGLGWYSSNYPSALKKLARVFPELGTDQYARDFFTALVAVTSNGEKVKVNIKNAITLYRGYRNGKNLLSIKIGTRRDDALKNNLRELQGLIDDFGIEKASRVLMEELTVSEINAELRRAGKKPESDYPADMTMPRAALYFGPKLGAFYANLRGAEGYLTMDLWWSRTFNRMRGVLIPKATDSSLANFRKMLDKPDLSREETVAATIPFRMDYEYRNFMTELEVLAGVKEKGSAAEKNAALKKMQEAAGPLYEEMLHWHRLEKTANTIYKNEYEMLEEAPFRASDRRFMYETTLRAQKILSGRGIDLSVADIQAALWYYEKRLYATMAGRKADDIGYDEAINEYAKSNRPQRPTTRFDRGATGGSSAGAESAQDQRTLPAQDQDAEAGRGGAQEDGAGEEGQLDTNFSRAGTPSVVFEVAPDPNDAPLANAWRSIPQDKRLDVSNRVAKRVIGEVLQFFGAEGRVLPQVGSYLDDTNPSFALSLKSGEPLSVAKFLGFVLSQDSMVVMSPDPYNGLSETGAVTVDVGDKSVEEIDAIYQSLREIEIDGEQPVGGQSTIDGKMLILNYSNVDTPRLAQLVDAQLGGAYTVEQHETYTAFPEKQDYDYASEKSNAGRDEEAIRQRAGALRAETGAALRAELAAEGIQFSRRSAEPADRSGSERGGRGGQDVFVARARQPDAREVSGVHYGKVPIAQLDGRYYGTGIKGAEAKRLASSTDPRIRRRVYFYIAENGQTPEPEQGLGNYVHRMRAGNVLFPGEQMAQLWRAAPDGNSFETAVIDAGYDGYADTNQGMFVLLDVGPIPVKMVGMKQQLSTSPRQTQSERPGTRREGNELVRRLSGQESAEFVNKRDQLPASARMEFGEARINEQDRDAANEQLSSFQFSRAQQGTPEFRRWFGLSKIVNPDGTPRVMYHGTARDVSMFIGKQVSAIFVTKSPLFAEEFSDFSREWMIKNLEEVVEPAVFDQVIKESIRMDQSLRGKPIQEIKKSDAFMFDVAPKYLPSGPNIIPVYVKAEDPFDYESGAHMMRLREQARRTNPDFLPMLTKYARDIRAGHWSTLETPAIQDLIRGAGFDSFYMYERGEKNLAVYSPTQIKSAVGNSGAFDPDDPRIQFSRKPIAGNTYTLPARTRTERTANQLSNEVSRVVAVQKAVAEQGGTVTPRTDIETAVHRMYGRAGSRLDWFRKEVVRPIIEKAARDGISLDDVALYLYAQHAEERNKQIAKINKSMPDGGSGMDTADARSMLQAFRRRRDYAQLKQVADQLQAITGMTQSVLTNSGLVDQATVAKWNAAYGKYVPLKSVEVADDDGGRTGNRKFDPARDFAQRAKGRSSEAGQIIENILKDYEEAVVFAEKNHVRKAFLKFVLDNPDQGLWEVDRQQLVAKFIKPTNLSPLGQVRYMMEKMDGDNTVSVRVNGKAHFIWVADPALIDDLTYGGLMSKAPQMIRQLFGVWSGINRALSKLWTAYSPAFVLKNAARDVQTALINAGVENGGAVAKRLGKQLLPAAHAILKMERDSSWSANPEMKKFYDMYRADGGKTGFLDLKSVEERQRELISMYRNMVASQGKVSWRNAHRKALVYAQKAEDMILDVNGAIENAARLAAYRAVLETEMQKAGVTTPTADMRVKATNVAKEITVNFNRRGKLTPALSSLYLFWNPAVQGALRTGRLLKSRRGQIAMGSLVALGYLAALAASTAVGDDGEPYWDKEANRASKIKNLMFFYGDGDSVSIPLPYGMGFFVNLGYAIRDLQAGQSPMKVAKFMRDSLFIHFSPLGAAENMATFMSPTILDPAIVLTTEKREDGMPLMPQNQFGQQKPDSERYWESSRGTMLQELTTAVNEMTGGSPIREGMISMSPEEVSYLWSYATGGVGTFFKDALQSIDLALNVGPGAAVEQNKVPFLKDYYRNNTGRMDRSAFHQNSEEAITALNEWKLAMENPDALTDKAMERVAENESVAMLGTAVDAYKKAMAELRKQEIAVKTDDSLTREERYDILKDLAEERRQLEVDFNREFYAASKQD